MKALTYTPVPSVCEGKRTNNTLQRLLKEVQDWARENDLPELMQAMKDGHGLTMTCWTEVDESLSCLNHAVRSIDRGETAEAVVSMKWAMEYLHRWQDRGGAIGNCDVLSEEDLTGCTLEDGTPLPASLASAKIERPDEIAKGLRIVKSAFGLPATLSIPLKLLESDELTEKWPLVLERLRAPTRFGKVA